MKPFITRSLRDIFSTLPKMHVIPLIFLASCTIQEQSQHAAVLTSVEHVMTAINSTQPQLLHEWMIPDAQILGMHKGKPPQVSTVDEMAESIGQNSNIKMHERTWSPQVKVSGAIANVWINYDFTVNNQLSHSGVNSIHLINLNGKWLVNNITYSIFPTLE